jgi:hypothetical protein
MSEAEDLVERWQSADPFARALIPHARYALAASARRSGSRAARTPYVATVRTWGSCARRDEG